MLFALQSLVSSLDYENPHLLAVLTSLSQIALLEPQLFANKHKAVVKLFVLKKLLMVDRVSISSSDDVVIIIVHCIIVYSVLRNLMNVTRNGVPMRMCPKKHF